MRFLMVLVALACASTFGFEPTEVRVKVTSISDGDTIDFRFVNRQDRKLVPGLKKKRVRFLYMDTPETHYKKNRSQKISGAGNNLKRLAPVGSEVTLRVYDAPTGRFGRVLATIHTDDGVNCNLDQVRKGWAFPFFYGPTHPDTQTYVEVTTQEAPKYIEAYRLAQADKVGMFAIDFQPLMDFPLIPHQFRSFWSGRPETEYVGNLKTGEVVEGVEAFSIPVEYRVFLPLDGEDLSIDEASEYWDEIHAQFSEKFLKSLDSLGKKSR